jgi:hypothetical protein
MAITSTTLSTTAQTIFTSAGTQGDAITTMYVCNVSNANQTFNIHLVPAGGTASNTNIIYCAFPVTSTDTYVIEDRILLNPGDTVQGLASNVNSIVVTVSSLSV